jgi:hypothetical protein
MGGKTMPLSVGSGNPGYGVPATEGGATLPPLGYGVQPDAQPGIAVTADNKTAPPKGYEVPQKSVLEDNKTVPMMREKMGIEPVVGWLVCVNGAQKGKSYELKGRINTIGRSEKMDISIKGDKTISNENHARLGYAEKNNHFTLIPAENKNVIYINGEDVYAPVALTAYDVIEFGESKLLFVPLCGEKFDWSTDTAGGDRHVTD